MNDVFLYKITNVHIGKKTFFLSESFRDDCIVGWKVYIAVTLGTMIQKILKSHLEGLMVY